jgi:hypothetical protein
MCGATSRQQKSSLCCCTVLRRGCAQLTVCQGSAVDRWGHEGASPWAAVALALFRAVGAGGSPMPGASSSQQRILHCAKHTTADILRQAGQLSCSILSSAKRHERQTSGDSHLLCTTCTTKCLHP